MSVGECSTCRFVGICKETSVQLIVDEFTCLRYEAVDEVEYWVRMRTRQTFGYQMLAEALTTPPEEVDHHT